MQQILRDAGLPFTINPRLVRGLDYYNLTVFEWVTDKLGAQGTVCAGGRYDGLVEQLGGKSTPACGFAMGVERLVALIRDAGGAPPAEPVPMWYTLCIRAVAGGWRSGWRGCAIRGWTCCYCGGRFVQITRMKKADGSGAGFAVIIGDDEAATGNTAEGT